MRYGKIVLCLIVVLFANVSSLQAATTFKGKSGLINIPSAYVMRPGHGGVGYFNTTVGESMAGNISLPNGFELAYSRWKMDRAKDVNLYSVKYALTNETVLKPAIAIGIEDIGDKYDRSFYIATSKQMPFGLRLHMGARSGDEAEGLFYGMEKQFRLDKGIPKKNGFIPVLNLMLEYDGHNFNYGAFIRNSKGVRFDFNWHDDTFRLGMQFEF